MGNSKVCGICNKEKVFTECLGCETAVCERCSCLELVGSGCGCVWPVYYCIKCVYDPRINPNAVFKDGHSSLNLLPQ